MRLKRVVRVVLIPSTFDGYRTVFQQLVLLVVPKLTEELKYENEESGSDSEHVQEIREEGLLRSA